jgi:hypothetical protein
MVFFAIKLRICSLQDRAAELHNLVAAPELLDTSLSDQTFRSNAFSGRPYGVLSSQNETTFRSRRPSAKLLRYGVIFNAPACIRSAFPLLHADHQHIEFKSPRPARGRRSRDTRHRLNRMHRRPDREVAVATGFRQYFLASHDATMGALLYRYKLRGYSGI